ncbi:MAG TPA: transporter substrate-binding domain-containing protein [Gammaproteobacteria bacterium]
MRATIRPFLLMFLFPLVLSACERQAESSAAESAAAQAAGPAAEDGCRLVMGWDPWPPYQFQDVHGDVAGLDIEIALTAAAAGGCTIEMVQGPWRDLVNRLRTGDIHLLAGATRTPGREAFADFTEPYRSESFVVYTRAENTGLRDINTLDALIASGVRLGSVTEYYYGAELSGVLNQLDVAGRLQEASLPELNYERLRMGEIDAFIEDPFVASAFMRNRAEAGMIAATGIKVNAADVAFMLARTGLNENYREKFRHGLASIRDDGRLAKIIESWRALP